MQTTRPQWEIHLLGPVSVREVGTKEDLKLTPSQQNLLGYLACQWLIAETKGSIPDISLAAGIGIAVQTVRNDIRWLRQRTSKNCIEGTKNRRLNKDMFHIDVLDYLPAQKWTLLSLEAAEKILSLPDETYLMMGFKRFDKRKGKLLYPWISEAAAKIKELREGAHKRLLILQSSPRYEPILSGKVEINSSTPIEDEKSPIESRPPSVDLEAPLMPLVGRQDEIAAWQSLLLESTTRIMRLSGPGGIGKTRSALELAWRCAETSHAAFPDGIKWINLSDTRTEDEMIQRLVTRLDPAYQPPPDAKDQLLRYLSRQQSLLFLDNTEQNPDAGKVIDEVLRKASRLKLVVTSRFPLDLPPGSERIVEVEPLSVAESRQLFNQVALSQGQDLKWTDEEVDMVCQYLEGIPLAVQLAAARSLGFDAQSMSEQLTKRLQFLRTRRTHEDQRKTALYASIDWSYQLLDPWLQKIFVQLSIFYGGFTMRDAVSICNRNNVEEGIQELHGHSMLRYDAANKRFFMLESIREFALDQMPPAGSRTLSQRHWNYFLEFTQERIGRVRSPKEAFALYELEQELPNVLQALHSSLNEKRFDTHAALSLATGSLYERRGFFQQAVVHIESGLDSVMASTKTSNRSAASLAEMKRLGSQLRLERAGLHLDQGEPREAIPKVKASLRDYRATGDQIGELKALNQLGIATGCLGKFEESFECFAKAFEILERPTQRAIPVELRALVLTNWGRFLEEADRLEEAEVHLREAQQLYRQAGDIRGLAESSTNLGVVYYRESFVEKPGCTQEQQLLLNKSWECYQEALCHEHDLNHVYGLGRALFNLSEVAQASDDAGTAFITAKGASYAFQLTGAFEETAARELLEKLPAPSEPLQDFVSQMRGKSTSTLSDELVAWVRDRLAASSTTFQISGKVPVAS